MTFKIPCKPPHRAMSEDWRRWSKTLASALLVGLPLGLGAQSSDASEELASRDVSEWNAEHSFEVSHWSTTLELKARATIKTLATNIAALPSLIAGHTPAATHPLYKPQSQNEFDWSASWQQDAQVTCSQAAGFWVELDCERLLDSADSLVYIEQSLSAEACSTVKSKQQYSHSVLNCPMSLPATFGIGLIGHPVSRAQSLYAFGRVIDPSVYADQTLS